MRLAVAAAVGGEAKKKNTLSVSVEAWEESQHHIDETSEGVNKGKVAEEGNPTRSLYQPLVAKREGHTQPSATPAAW